MRRDEEKKLAEMSAWEAYHFLAGRIDDIQETLSHIEENCDTGQSDVVMCRLSAYHSLMLAESRLLFRLITERNLAKATQSKGEK